MVPATTPAPSPTTTLRNAASQTSWRERTSASGPALPETATAASGAPTQKMPAAIQTASPMRPSRPWESGAS